jgi:lysophospholipase L1-like esterase
MDVSGKRIAILGDSHVDGSTCGRALEQMLRDKGATVSRFGWGGTAARTWLAGKPLRSGTLRTLEQVNAGGPYDLALVVLGTNDGANSEAAAAQGGPSMVAGVAKAAQEIKQVADRVNAKKVIWVGPPMMGDITQYYTSASVNEIWRVTSPLFGSAAIDSREVTRPYVSGDGVHLGKEGGTVWAQYVLTEVEKQQAGIGPFSAPVLAASALAAVLVAVAIRVRLNR